MKLISKAFITTLVFSTLLTAHAQKTFPDSPLLEGTKILAGDPKKDEFFIVADNDVYAVKEPAVKSVNTDENKKTTPISVAENEIKPARVNPKAKVAAPNLAANTKDEHNTARAIKVALDKIAEKKTIVPNKETVKKTNTLPIPLPFSFAQKENVLEKEEKNPAEQQRKKVNNQKTFLQPSATKVVLATARKCKAPAIQPIAMARKIGIAFETVLKDSKAPMKVGASKKKHHPAISAMAAEGVANKLIAMDDRNHKEILAALKRAEHTADEKPVMHKSFVPVALHAVYLGASQIQADKVELATNKKEQHVTTLPPITQALHTAQSKKLHNANDHKKRSFKPGLTQAALSGARKIKAPLSEPIPSKEVAHKAALAIESTFKAHKTDVATKTELTKHMEVAPNSIRAQHRVKQPLQKPVKIATKGDINKTVKAIETMLNKTIENPVKGQGQRNTKLGTHPVKIVNTKVHNVALRKVTPAKKLTANKVHNKKVRPVKIIAIKKETTRGSKRQRQVRTAANHRKQAKVNQIFTTRIVMYKPESHSEKKIMHSNKQLASKKDSEHLNRVARQKRMASN